MNNLLELLKRLCEVDGTSGDEDRVRALIQSEIVGGDVKTDNLGNLIVFKKGRKAPKNKVMLAAHMDEVGFMITHITDDGLLKFGAVGGIDARVVIGRQLRLASGAIGVVGTKAVHQQSADEKDKAPQIDELFIDIGAASRAEAEKFVKLGDTACFTGKFTALGNGFVKCKAIDDRAGCAVMLDMLGSELEYDAYFVFTTQEEVGTRGAKAAVESVRPDMAIVLETTTACDIAGVSGEKKVCVLGNGVVASFMDRGTIYDKKLYRLAFEEAEKIGVKCQTKTVIAGGNDSRAIHMGAGGVRTLALSVPTRYLHSPACVMNTDDFAAQRKLAETMLERLAEL